MRTITVVDYDPNWPEEFLRLRSQLWPAVSDVALAVEHVGSTSVPGLAAKPIIDVSVVVRSQADIPSAINRLAPLGYVHLGQLGVEGREAFDSPVGSPPHHLYACPRGSISLGNHLAVRSYLRRHPNAAREYGELKKRLARQFPCDIDSYVDGKTGFTIKLLRNAGFTSKQLEAIEHANRKAV